MDELDEIKERKKEQLQQEAQLQQQVAQLEAVVKQIFTKEALERYGNLKAAHPEKAVQLLVILGQAIQSQRINQVDDEQLKEILKKLTPAKKEFKIRGI